MELNHSTELAMKVIGIVIIIGTFIAGLMAYGISA